MIRPVTAGARNLPRGTPQVLKFVLSLIRPYRGRLIDHSAGHGRRNSSRVSPLPGRCKYILDNVIGVSHKVAPLLHHAVPHISGYGSRIALCRPRCAGLRGHLRPGSYRDLHRQLLHRKRWPVRRPRPPHAHVPSSAAPVPWLLQHPSDRHDSQHHYYRHPDHPGLRVVLHARTFSSTCSPSSACSGLCSG